MELYMAAPPDMEYPSQASDYFAKHFWEEPRSVDLFYISKKPGCSYDFTIIDGIKTYHIKLGRSFGRAIWEIWGD